MTVFLRYTNKSTGRSFYTNHENIEHSTSFLRKVRNLAKEIGRDAKCTVQEVSEETYRAANVRTAA